MDADMPPLTKGMTGFMRIEYVPIPRHDSKSGVMQRSLRPDLFVQILDIIFLMPVNQ
jgi:hypothetical protein